MSLYIVDIHGELEGDYEIIRKYEEPTAKNDIAQERYQDLIEYFGDEKVAKTILESKKEFKAWLERLRWNTKKVDELARELEQLKSTAKNDLVLIHTEGLDEGIRCAMCTNYMRSDRGCDGNCIVDKDMHKAVMNVIKKSIQPSVTPQPRKGYLSIDDAMSVFDDFMCDEVDEDGTETFLEMLKDKVGSEEQA